MSQQELSGRGKRLVRITDSFLEQINETLGATHSDVHGIHADMHMMQADIHAIQKDIRALTQTLIALTSELKNINVKEGSQMATLEDILTEVRNTREVEAAAKTAILAALAKIEEEVQNNADPEVMQGIIDELRAGADDLAAAIPANTPSAPPASTDVPPDTDPANPNPPVEATPDGNA
jgi:septal ring factor EnvC (AmiA/AmiB activator)